MAPRPHPGHPRLPAQWESPSETSRRCSVIRTRSASPSTPSPTVLGVEIDRVIGIEARGFILAAPLAYRRGASFVPVRKAGKLPWAVAREEYILEYGTDKLEVHRDGMFPGERVLVVDDVLATGGTAAATVRLVEGLGAEVVGLGFAIEIGPLGGRTTSRATRWRASSRTSRKGAPWPPSTGSCRGGGTPRSRPTRSPVVDAFRHRHPKAPIATIVRAYEVAAEAHEHQYRKSGEKASTT